MPNANPAHVSFSAGEVSPYIYGRVDLAKYQTGARSLENFIVLPQGPILKRRGTRYLTGADNPSARVRLVDFVFSRTDWLVMEFTEGRILFLDSTGYVDDPVGSGLLEVTTPYLETELDDLSIVQQGNLVLIAHRNHPTKKLLRQSDGSWSFEDMDFVDGPYLDPNEDEDLTLSVALTEDKITLVAASDTFVVGDVGKYLEFKEGAEWRLGIVSDYVDAKTVKIDADVYDRVLTMGENVIVYYNSEPYAVTEPGAFSAYNSGGFIRATVQSWSFRWARLDQNTVGGNNNSTTHQCTFVDPTLGTVLTYGRTVPITVGERSTLGTITASKSIFTEDDIGRHIRLKFENSWTWCKITGYTSSKVVDAHFYAAIPRDSRDLTRLANGGSTSIFRLGAWCANTSYPGVVAFFEQRAVFASTVEQPQTMWFSVTDDYENHAPTELDSTVTDSSGITYTIATSEVNTIAWLSGAQTLLIGTIGAEYQARAASTVQEPVTPRNISVTRQGSHGSRMIRPLMINAATLFVAATGRAVYEMVYSFENDSFVTRDMTIFSEHILRDARAIAFQQDPHRVIWVLLGDGTLAGCTYLRDQEVAAWHRHTLGSGTVESLCAVPFDDGSREVVFLSVLRDGVRCIEILDTLFEPGKTGHADYLDARPFMDSYETASFAGGSTLSGLSRFIGSTVSVVCAGVHVGDYEVTEDSVDLGTTLTGTVTYGFWYASEVEGLPLDTGSEIGTGRGKVGRIDRIGLVLVKSLYFSFYDGESWIEERLSHTATSPNYTSLYSGTLRFLPFDSYSEEQVVHLSSRRPYPLCIAAILPEHKTND